MPLPNRATARVAPTILINFICIIYLRKWYNTLYDAEEYAEQEQTQFGFSPEISTSATYEVAKWLAVNLFYKFTGSGKTYQTYNDELVLGGLNSYNWADLSISSSILTYFNISAGIKNLFDITRVDNNISTAGGGHGSTVTGSRLIGCNRSFFMGISKIKIHVDL